jgi:hypothetical protein
MNLKVISMMREAFSMKKVTTVFQYLRVQNGNAEFTSCTSDSSQLKDSYAIVQYEGELFIGIIITVDESSVRVKNL